MQSIQLHSCSSLSKTPCIPLGQRHPRQQWQQQPAQRVPSQAVHAAGRLCQVHTHAVAVPPLWSQQQAHRQQHVLAATGSNHPQTSPQQQQQQQQQQDVENVSTKRPKAQKVQQQQQQASSSSAAEPQQEKQEEDEQEWDSDDEYEGEEEYEDLEEGEWDEDEWEDEDEDEDANSTMTPAVRQIPQDQATVDFTQDDFVEVGMISRPHGVRGEVKVQLITDEPKKRLGTAGKRLWLQALPVRSGLVPPSAAAARQGGAADPFKTLRRVVVQSGRVARPGAKGQREEWAVKFEGYNSREQAADLAGYKLLLALCDREARPRGRDMFFVDQLVGLKALDATSGILVGIVTEVYDNGASYSLLRVRLAPGEEEIQASRYRSVLVPFVTDIVPDVDLEGGKIGLALPEGLLETASTTKLRKAYTPEQQQQLREQLKKRQQQQGEWEEQQQ